MSRFGVVEAFPSLSWVTRRTTRGILCCLLALVGFGACAGGEKDFAFVILADPHIAGSPENEMKLGTCVEWIREHRETEQIELVFVVGDIGWGPAGLDRAKAILDGLDAPYVPLPGDNEIQFGSEQAFDTTFAPHFEFLAHALDRWKKAPSPVWNPQVGKPSFLQNFSFDWKGVHFVCLDWCSRIGVPLLEEQAELHDFPGGTWRWFVEDLSDLSQSPKESVILVSHHPMHAEGIAAFSRAEFRSLCAFMAPFGEVVYADFAGHYHVYWHETIEGAGYELYVTEAVSFLLPNLSLVEVSRVADGFRYRHRWIVPAFDEERPVKKGVDGEIRWKAVGGDAEA